ncbi:MAG: FecR domain-containing protein, partial [Gammaproteobacteria bacterium]|nr:FecR domain-containing protein [Gammaproteobacteria bacterium]
VEEKKENQWSAVKRDDIFCAGDIVRTRKNSRAILRLTKEQTNITLAQHTTISFGPQNEKKPTWLELLKGAANFISRVPQSLNIKTPYVNAAIEGTEFLITVKEDHSEVSVFEGHVALSNENGKLDLKTGETGIATEGQAPALSIKVNPVDAVQWTMYYPPVISKPKNTPAGSFPPTDENNNDPKLLTYSASQFLAVGRVEQAEQNIEKALSINKGDSNALALKSIILPLSKTIKNPR